MGTVGTARRNMEDKLKRLNELHVNVWHLHKKYFHLPISGTDQEWEELMKDYQALEERYKDDDELDLIRYQLVRAVVDTIDRRFYDRKGQK